MSAMSLRPFRTNLLTAAAVLVITATTQGARVKRQYSPYYGNYYQVPLTYGTYYPYNQWSQVYNGFSPYNGYVNTGYQSGYGYAVRNVNPTSGYGWIAPTQPKAISPHTAPNGWSLNQRPVTALKSGVQQPYGSRMILYRNIVYPGYSGNGYATPPPMATTEGYVTPMFTLPPVQPPKNSGTPIATFSKILPQQGKDLKPVVPIIEIITERPTDKGFVLKTSTPITVSSSTVSVATSSIAPTTSSSQPTKETTTSTTTTASTSSPSTATPTTPTSTTTPAVTTTTSLTTEVTTEEDRSKITQSIEFGWTDDEKKNKLAALEEAEVESSGAEPGQTRSDSMKPEFQKPPADSAEDESTANFSGSQESLRSPPLPQHVRDALNGLGLAIDKSPETDIVY